MDADHTDTAVHRIGKEAPEGLSLLPAKRLAALRIYVGRLGAGKPADSRTGLRQLVFDESLRASTKSNLVFCDSAVGTGKTTAVMAHLLRAAEDRPLRRIFVVLPFTNIITQSSRVYRCALTLRGEKARDVVAEHHHRAEFPEGEGDRDSPARQYAALWHAPIVVVTAVQFFETLAAANTAGLRKLHQLPGSAIFIDEAHAALPAKLWPQAFRWLRQLVDDWGCHCVLASGSLPEFWLMKEFIDINTPVSVPSLLPDACRHQASHGESSRVQIRTDPDPLTLDGLTATLSDSPGPRLLVVNTVQNAAVIAQHLKGAWGQAAVEHVSTALTPEDRTKTYDRIRRRLRDRRDEHWTLVATSCVEAGVNFDFASGLRERASLMSLLQVSGRVNRHGLRGRGRSWTSRSRHIRYSTGIQRLSSPRWCLASCSEKERWMPSIVEMPCSVNWIGNISSRFWIGSRWKKAAQSFATVEDLFRVISAQTFTAVVKPELIERLTSFQPVPFRELQDGSVQLWLGKEREFALPEFPHLQGVYRWNLADGYDSFLGVMKGVCPC